MAHICIKVKVKVMYLREKPQAHFYLLPDIEFYVNYLSQFLDSYGHEYWQAVKKIIRYLKGTINIVISSYKCIGLSVFAKRCTKKRGQVNVKV